MCTRRVFRRSGVIYTFMYLISLFSTQFYIFVSGSGWYHLDLVGELGNICELAYPRTNQIN